MKYLINKVFYHSVGKILRLFQKSLINYDSVPGVQDLVNRNAVQESSDYAIKNFSQAMQELALLDLQVQDFPEKNKSRKI